MYADDNNYNISLGDVEANRVKINSKLKEVF